MKNLVKCISVNFYTDLVTAQFLGHNQKTHNSVDLFIDRYLDDIKNPDICIVLDGPSIDYAKYTYCDTVEEAIEKIKAHLA